MRASNIKGFWSGTRLGEWTGFFHACELLRSSTPARFGLKCLLWIFWAEENVFLRRGF